MELLCKTLVTIIFVAVNLFLLRDLFFPRTVFISSRVRHRDDPVTASGDY